MPADTSVDDALAGFRVAQRRRSLLVGAVTAAALLASFSILAVILLRVNREIDAKQAELNAVQHDLHGVKETLQRERMNLDSLVRDIDAKSAQLAKLSNELAAKEGQVTEVKTLVKELPETPLTTRIKTAVAQSAPAKPPPPPDRDALPPIARQAAVRLSLSPTKDTFMDRPVYNVRIWIDVPKARAAEVLKAEYVFEHPSFVPNTRTSFDAATGFAFAYRGYGCVDAKAAVVTRDGVKHPLPFDMCALWVAALPASPPARVAPKAPL